MGRFACQRAGAKAVKPAVLRPLAEQDLLRITRWYIEQGGSRLGGRAFDAARKALARIEQMPALGSLRFGERCNLPGLRHWSVEKFPIRWFYKPIDPALYAAQWVEQVADVEFDLKAVNPREKKGSGFANTGPVAGGHRPQGAGG